MKKTMIQLKFNSFHKGYLLCIRLNSVDPNHYVDETGRPWDGKLQPIEYDVKVIQDIAKSQNFEVSTLTKPSTIESVLKGIKNASDKLQNGVFLCYIIRVMKEK